MVSSILSTALAACGALSCQDHQVPTGIERSLPTLVLDTALVASADTYVRGGTPNTNYGADPFLRNMASDRRALVRFDQAQIAAVVGADSLASATLELTVSVAGVNWGSPGRYIDLHRLTQTWTELGATWTCAIDADPGDGDADCGDANGWVMGSPPSSNPWIATPTASVLVSEGMVGVVQFNVTADVRAFLAGTANYGWLLKKADESAEGRIDFASKESTAKPRLLLSIVQGDTSRPAIPTTIDVSGPLLQVASPGNAALTYNRDRYEVRFADSTSGATVRAFLAQFSAVIVGGYSATAVESFYLVRVPDPGPTWAAVDSLARFMASRPGVEWVHPSPAGILILRGRFPIDAQIAATRSSWQGTSAAVRVWTDIRAPLGWGCETGLYGGRRARVGVLDAYFDSVHTDVVSSVSSPVVNPAPSVMITNPMPDGPLVHNHGIGVAGVISARGDNDSGTVGVVWWSDLRLYGTRRQDQRARDEGIAFLSLFGRAATDGVQVLNLSIGLGGSSDSSFVRQLRQHIKKYLNSGVDRLIVQAAGNETLTMSIDSVRTNADDRVTALDRALAQLYDTLAYRDRIIFVTGANLQHAHYFNSNVWLGAGMMVAPAESVRVLSGGSGADWGFFTSVESPFVSGAAAQLFSFDSTLTGADVKRLLFSGAREPRLASNGAFVPPAAVPGTDNAFMLDTYGSLTLRAKEVNGLPICGYPVRIDTSRTTIVLDAPAPAGRSFTAGVYVKDLSVAQGGRRIAAGLLTASEADSTVIFSHTGAQIAHYANQWRSFLERDTLIQQAQFDATGRPLYPVMTLKGPSFPSFPNGFTFNPFLQLPPDTNRNYGTAFVSPAADLALLIRRTQELSSNPSGCHADLDSIQWYLTPISSGNATLLATDVVDGCNLQGQDQVPGADWSHDGRTAVFSIGVSFNNGAVQSQIRRATSTGVSQQATLTGFLTQQPAFLSDDSLVEWTEGTFDSQSGAVTTCERKLRNGQSPFASVAGTQTPVVPLYLCDGQTLPVRYPNVRSNALSIRQNRAWFLLFESPAASNRRLRGHVARAN